MGTDWFEIFVVFFKLVLGGAGFTYGYTNYYRAKKAEQRWLEAINLFIAGYWVLWIIVQYFNRFGFGPLWVVVVAT